MCGRRRLQPLEDLYENNSRGQQKTEVHGVKAQERKCQNPFVQKTTEEEDWMNS